MLGSFLNDLLGKAVRALTSAGIDYALVGGTALLLAGRDRNTRDVDVVAILQPGQLQALIASSALEGFSHSPSKDVYTLESVTIYRFFLFLEDVEVSLSLDVQIGNTPYHEAVMERARPLALAGLELKVASLEDLIILKLIAFRPIDRADCLHLLRLYPELDKAYLQSWVERLDLESRWLEVVSLNT